MTDPVLLEKNYPGLFQDLKNHSENELSADDFEIEKTAEGLPVLKIKGMYIHSLRGPEREGRRQVESLLNTAGADNGPIIILGFGMGYSAIAAADAAPGRPLIIVEKRELLRAAFEHRDLGQFLLNNKTAFVTGHGEQVISALSIFDESRGKPVVIKNRALISLDEDWYNEAEQKINTWASRNEINRATLKRFGRRWVRNLSKNLTAIRDLPGISRLKDILKDTNIPVFLVAAGPTLEDAAKLIPQIALRCVVVAVDTSLRFALKTGTEPDFVVSLDPQYWNFRHLDRTIAPNVSLIAESAVYPPCLRHPFKNVFLCGSLFPLGRFIEDRIDPKGEVGAGGSVATAAWDFARTLGTSAIWIAGLDLSFPSLKTHFKGAVFEEKSHSQSYRFSPGETWSVKALRDGGPFKAKNTSGGRVLTDKRLSLYASWFENRFSAHKIKNYCLSGEGLAIKGLEAGNINELLNLPDRRNEINALLEKTFSVVEDDYGYAGESPEAKNRAVMYEKTLKTLLDGLKNVKNIAEEAGALAETWEKRIKSGHYPDADMKNVLGKLDKANKSITSSAVKEVAGFLFPDMNELGKNLSLNQTNPLLNHLEFSKIFYKALSEAINYNLKYLS